MAGNVSRSNTLFFNKRKGTTFDFGFMDKIIRESFYIGGTDLVVYRALGTYNQLKNIVSSSNPEQSFSAFSTSETPRREAKKAFNGDPATYYESANLPDIAGNEFIEIDFGEALERYVVINGFGIQQFNLGSLPATIDVLGSPNGISFNLLDTIQLSDSVGLVRYDINNTAKHRKYRFVAKEATFTNILWTVAILELYSEAGEDNQCGIQDTFLLENRDRRYDKNGCTLLCHYEIPEKPHDLSKFGFIIPSDQIEITTLRSDAQSILGRDLFIGDIVTLPHVGDHSHDEGGEIDKARLVDPKTPDEIDGRRYEVLDISIAAAGYDVRWRDHLLRVVAAPLKDGIQTIDITGSPDDIPTDAGEIRTRDLLEPITDSIHTEAANAGELGLDMSLIAHPTDVPQEIGPYTADAFPPNDEAFTEGVDFPSSPTEDQWFRHTGYDPIRLYQFNGSRWVRKEIEFRESLDGRETVRGTNKDHLALPVASTIIASTIQQTLRDKS